MTKQKASFLCKTTSKEFEFLPKSNATAVAMATMAYNFNMADILATLPACRFLPPLN
jgi:hypothetical protein